jgi:hypothetical protein
VTAFVLSRIERSYVAIGRAIDALDGWAFARRRGLTVPMAREALSAAGFIDESHEHG